MHDIVEDTDFTIKMVELTFGKIVSEIVSGLTRVIDDKKLTVPELLSSVLTKEYLILKEEKVNIKTTISLLLLDCMWPVVFYFVYMYCPNISKYSFKYSAEQIIQNNFIVSIVMLASTLIIAFLNTKIYPLLHLKIKLVISSITLIMAPFLLNLATSGRDILIVQCLILFFACGTSVANGIFFKYFPVFKRFTFAAVIYAISRALVYVITSFGLVYLTDYFGNYGIYFIIIPAIIGFGYGLNHFIKLEKEAGILP